MTVRESIGLQHALVAVLSGDQSLAGALSSVHIAARVAHRSQGVTRAVLATVWVVLVQIPETILAGIATASLGVRLAVATASLQARVGVTHRVTDSIVKGSTRVTVAG